MGVNGVHRVAVVSLRLPVRVRVHDGKPTLVPSVGGVATGLRRALPDAERRWIGWSGAPEGLDAEALRAVEDELRERRLAPVCLDLDLASRFYSGFANRTLWPLFHSLPERIPLRLEGWDAYVSANEAFARTVVEVTSEDELIWVHDYQLMLVPQMVRELRPRARVAFFLHIPFPSNDVFSLLPQRQQVLAGLLGADQIAFHTADYRANFVQALRAHGAGDDVRESRVRTRGHTVRLEVAPMGIDVARFEDLGERALQRGDVVRVRPQAHARLIAGVDRLDYTKGIPRRLLAFEHLLEHHPRWREHVVFVQIAVPSRTDVDAYRVFAKEIEQLVGRINGAYGTPQWTPIHYLHRGVPQREVAALYRAADVAFVTPIRDGMNLVAKEFVATRTDEDGVLVLSEFAGAASELVEAIIVNPYDIAATGDALDEALRMPGPERQARMRALRRRIRGHDVTDWAHRLLSAVPRGRGRRLPPRDPLPEALTVASHARHLTLLLDYDGTLVPFTVPLEAAVPALETERTLQRLASRPDTTVFVVSGRNREFLEQVLGASGVGLVAEHGAWWRPPGARRWRRTRHAGATRPAWQAAALAAMREVEGRTPGSRIEIKSRALAWHWRGVPAEFGAQRAEELAAALHARLPRSADIVVGDRVVEVRPRGVSKGAIVPLLQSETPPESTIVAIGDDQTDEDLFGALDDGAVTVHVGRRRSKARFRVPDVAAVLAILDRLAATNGDGRRA